MKQTWILGAALVAATCGGTISQAQEVKVGGPGFGGPIAINASDMLSNYRELLKRPEVYRQMKPNGAQETALRLLLDENNPANKPQPLRLNVKLEDNGNSSPEDRQKAIQDQIKEQLANMTGGFDNELKKILSPEQMKRLKEIDMQWRGPMALGRGQTAREARISAEHESEIVRLTAEFRKNRSQILDQFKKESESSSGGPNNQAIMKRISINTEPLKNMYNPERMKIEKMKRDTEAKILALLTPAERAGWDALQGAPITFIADKSNDLNRLIGF